MHKNILKIVIMGTFFCVIHISCPTVDAEAGVLGRSISKIAARKAAQRKAAQSAYARKVLKKDAIRDKATPAKPANKQLTVRRYTSEDQARKEAVMGISPKTHMTSRTPNGRPVSAATAQKRYGLYKKPEVQMILRVPKGQPVKKNKVIGGAPGYGEMTSTKSIPPQNIISIKTIR